ncbi:unnamed protein product [Clavelina lepadiformis]|uniref:Uncharacterized protein n=1 Tax=Clavelina lepadiformis TaxID=159417 RepID=A0ABP0G5D3_CLALP
MEFAKVQENTEDIFSKFLAQTKRTETMNNAMPFEETLQPSSKQSESDTSICIQEVHSEKASAIAHLEAIEDKSLSLQDIEFLPTETDATFTLTSNNDFPQSDNEGNATFDGEVVDSENLVSLQKISRQVSFMGKGLHRRSFQSCRSKDPYQRTPLSMQSLREIIFAIQPFAVSYESPYWGET